MMLRNPITMTTEKNQCLIDYDDYKGAQISEPPTIIINYFFGNSKFSYILYTVKGGRLINL